MAEVDVVGDDLTSSPLRFSDKHCGSSCSIVPESFGRQFKCSASGSQACTLWEGGAFGCCPPLHALNTDRAREPYRQEVTITSDSKKGYVNCGAAVFPKKVTDDWAPTCGSPHAETWWRFSNNSGDLHGAYATNHPVQGKQTRPIPDGAEVTMVLSYEDGVGTFSVTAEGETEPFVVAADLPPGCILFCGAAECTVTIVSGRSSLDAPVTKSARKR